MPTMKSKKWAIPAYFEESPSVARHCLEPGKKAKLPERALARVSNDHVIEDFNLEDLPRPNQVSGHLDVRL